MQYFLSEVVSIGSFSHNKFVFIPYEKVSQTSTVLLSALMTS